MSEVTTKKHEHSIYDTDPHFKIDPVTMAITTDAKKTVLIKGSHNCERFTFEIPKTIEGHDMSQCDKVEIHYLNVGSGSDRVEDIHEVDDFQVSPEDENVWIFSWLLDGNTCKFAGTLSFAIVFKCTDEDVTTYSKPTDIFKGITVKDTINNGEAVVEEHSDILQQWYDKLVSAGEYVTFDDIMNEVNAGVAKSWTNGGTDVDNQGRLKVLGATETHIKERDSSVSRPLMPKDVDLIVQEGLTNSTIGWTEKQIEKAWKLFGLNVLDNVFIAEYEATPFADILSAFQEGKICYLHGTSNAGYVLTHCYEKYAMFTRIMHASEKYNDKTSLGALQGIEVYPDETWNIATLFVKPTLQTLIDESVNSKAVQKVSTKTQRDQVYVKKSNGEQAMAVIGKGPFAEYIVQRDEDGQIQVPSEPKSYVSATSKQYVDNSVSAIKIPKVPTQKVIRTTEPGTLRCQPNTTYMIYCIGDEDATLRGYGSKNESKNDSGGYVNISAKVLSVTCGGVGDTYTDSKGNTIIKKWGDTEAEYFATAVQTGTVMPVSSINPRRGVVYDSSDTSQYAEISYPADCTIMINTTV